MGDLSTTEKVRHLIKVSLFLQESQRLELEQKLSTMNEAELKELEQILLDEDSAISSLVQDEIIKPDSPHLQKISSIKSRIVSKMVKKEENVVEKMDITKADDLLNSL